MEFADRPRWFVAGGGRVRARHVRGRGGAGEGGRGGRGRGRDWRDFAGEPPQRVERGGVRYLVLDALVETPRHGYEVMAAIDERSHGAYRPSPGVTYPTLQLLEELGEVRVTERDGKKVYAITAAGTRELEAHRDEVAEFYARSDDQRDDQADDVFEVMQRVRRLIRAFRRAARRGRLSPAVIAQVRATLDQTVARLEALVD